MAKKEFQFEVYKEEEKWPEIADWQIDEFYDREEVEWVDREHIKLHGKWNEGRKFFVRYDIPRKDKIVYIFPQTSTAIEWHRLTEWRNAKTLYKYYPYVWNNWKEQGLIPPSVIASVEK